MDWLTYEEALERVLSQHFPAPAIETVSLRHACGRVAASDVRSSIDVPGFDNSAMDGFAIAAKDYRENRVFPVSQRIAAGAQPAPLVAGTAARIFTGAVMPEGADSVILQEDSVAKEEGTVGFTGGFKAEQHVRLAGNDFKRGDLLVAAGDELSSRSIGLLASAGESEVKVFRRLKVALLNTGNELCEPGQSLEVGQIYNSNFYMLAAELESMGIEVLETQVCGDDAKATRTALQAAAEQADCIVTTGGMSVGEEDHVRREAEALGDLAFWKVAIKPGKPLAFGTIHDKGFFGLPGNPVSSFVTFFLFARPWLKRSAGITKFQNGASQALADFDYVNKGSRTEFIRVSLNESAVKGIDAGSQLTASIFRTQSSGVLSSLNFSDALAKIAPGHEVVVGQPLETLKFHG